MSPSLRRNVAAVSLEDESPLMQLRSLLHVMDTAQESMDLNAPGLEEIKGPFTALMNAANLMRTVLRHELNPDQLRLSAQLTHKLLKTITQWSRQI